jgi:hypothetical protein
MFQDNTDQFQLVQIYRYLRPQIPNSHAPKTQFFGQLLGTEDGRACCLLFDSRVLKWLIKLNPDKMANKAESTRAKRLKQTEK